MSASPTLVESLPRLLDESAVAALTGLDRHTLATWRCRRKGPPFLRLGRAVRYREADVRAWLASCEVPTAEATK
jgi:predicted DNA-binding transcriptional regulator AlpA